MEEEKKPLEYYSYDPDAKLPDWEHAKKISRIRRTENLPKAIEYAAKIEGLNEMPTALAALSNVFARMGDFDAARALSERVMQLEAPSGEKFNTWASNALLEGITAKEANDSAKAQACFERAHQLLGQARQLPMKETGFASNHILVSKTFIQQNKFEQGRQQLMGLLTSGKKIDHTIAKVVLIMLHTLAELGYGQDAYVQIAEIALPLVRGDKRNLAPLPEWNKSAANQQGTTLAEAAKQQKELDEKVKKMNREFKDFVRKPGHYVRPAFFQRLVHGPAVDKVAKLVTGQEPQADTHERER